MAYPREFVEQVRDAWLSGQFTSMYELAKHFKLKSVATIYAWKKRDKWDDLERRVRNRVSERMCDEYAERATQMNDTFWKLWGAVIGFVAQRIQQSMDKEKPHPLTITDMDVITRIVARAQQGQALVISSVALPEDDEAVDEVVVRYETLAEAIRRSQGNGAGGNGSGDDGDGVPIGGDGIVIGDGGG